MLTPFIVINIFPDTVLHGCSLLENAGTYSPE